MLQLSLFKTEGKNVIQLLFIACFFVIHIFDLRIIMQVQNQKKYRILQNLLFLGEAHIFRQDRKRFFIFTDRFHR